MVEMLAVGCNERLRERVKRDWPRKSQRFPHPKHPLRATLWVSLIRGYT